MVRLLRLRSRFYRLAPRGEMNEVHLKSFLAYMTHHKTKNVIIVDWSPLAKAPWYGDATYGAITVGEVVARLLHHFVEDCKVAVLKDAHIVGQSSITLYMWLLVGVRKI